MTFTEYFEICVDFIFDYMVYTSENLKFFSKYNCNPIKIINEKFCVCVNVSVNFTTIDTFYQYSLNINDCQ